MAKESYERPVMTVILLPGTGVVLTSCEIFTPEGFDECSGNESEGMCSVLMCSVLGNPCHDSGCEDAGSCPNHSGTGYICPTYDPNSGATAPCEVDPGGIGNG